MNFSLGRNETEGITLDDAESAIGSSSIKS